MQLTEEKLGTSERTELDSNLENLVERAECSRNWTEKIVKNSEAVLIPNPGNRVEDFIFEKIEKKKPTRLSNLEYLGLDMIEVIGRERPALNLRTLIRTKPIDLSPAPYNYIPGGRRLWPRR